MHLKCFPVSCLLSEIAGYWRGHFEHMHVPWEVTVNMLSSGQNPHFQLPPLSPTVPTCYHQNRL